jgi:hypothetical protein
MSKLTTKQEAAITALLTATSISNAAAKVGVNEKTIRRWLADPAFDAEYRAARRQAVGQAVALLQQLSSAAVVVIARIMADPQAPAGVKLRAAVSVLELAIKSVELEDLEARLAALEACYEKRETPPFRTEP